jgi:hypothetical protein
MNPVAVFGFNRANSDENSTANPDEKRSNTPSKPLSEINNVLHKSVDLKRKAVLFCSLCGHESPIEADWNVPSDSGQHWLECPDRGSRLFGFS